MAKMSQLTAANALSGAELWPIVQGGATRRGTMGALVTYLATFFGQGPKGDPGGNISAIGLFVDADGLDIPAGVDMVGTSGNSRPGVGPGLYAHDPDLAVPLGRGANLLIGTVDLTAAPWTPGVGANAATAAFDGTYTVLTDATAGYARWQQMQAVTGAYMTVEADIRKDAVPAYERKAIVRVFYADAAGLILKQYDTLVDTSEGTGYPGHRASGATSPATDIHVVDAGDDWRVVVSGQRPLGATQAGIRIYPANGPGNSSSSAATGTVSVRNVQLYVGMSELYDPPQNSGTSFTALDGRVFELMLDQLITPHVVGAIGDGITYDDAALATFNRLISASACPSVSWAGDFAHAFPLTMGPLSGVIATSTIRGRMTLHPAPGVATVVTLQNMYGCNWDGIFIVGNGGLDYDSRSNQVGVMLKGNCGRMIGQSVDASNFLFSSLLCFAATGDNYNFAKIERVSGNNIGSGSGTQGGIGSLATAWTYAGGVENETFSQRTAVTVDVPFPEWITGYGALADNFVQLRIEGKSYRVTSIDRTTTPATVNLYPRLPAARRTSGATGTGRWIFGGRVMAMGGNAGILRFGVIDGAASGRCLYMGSLHGIYVSTINSSFDGQGIFCGRSTSGITLSNIVERCYFEASTVPEEIVVATPFGALEVRDVGQSDPARWVDAGAPRLNDDSWGLQSGSENCFRNVALHYRGKRLEWQRRGIAYRRPTAVTLDATFGQYQDIGDSLTVNLSAAGAPIGAHFGHNGGVVRRLGSGANGAPLNPLVVNAPPGGTIDGQATVSVAGKAVQILTADPANLVWFTGATG